METTITTTTTKSAPRFGSRWIGTILLFFICMISYMDRSNLAVSTPTILKDLKITPVQMGLITSLFSIGYGALQIPAALMARKFGTRLTLSLAILLWSIFTVLTGAVGGFLSLLLVRFLFGVVESPLFISVNSFNVRWFPPHERASANAFPTAGAYLAPVITPPLTVLVLTTLGWHWVFILSGIIGLVIMVVWYLWARDNPEQHSQVSAEELSYIQSNQDFDTKPTKIPWKQFFKSRSFWGIGITYFCSLYFIQFFLYWLPYFLQHQLGMSLTSMGFASSLPWLFIGIAAFGIGRLSDRLVKANYSKFISRNVLIILGFSVSAVLIYSTMYVHNAWGVVWLMSVALGFAGFTSIIPLAISSDIGGELTGVIYGWINMWGFAGGAVMPIVASYVGTHFGWDYSLFLLVFICLIGVIATLFVKSDQKIRV